MGAFILYMAMAGGGNIPFGNFESFEACSGIGSGIFNSDPRTYIGYSCIQEQ